MANEKLDLDWFPLKWQKFVIGTSNMKADEIGGYILLLIREWDKGYLPDNIEELSKTSKLSRKKLSKVLEKFENIDGKLYNDTLEIIRIEQQEKANKSSNKGIKGAKARWDKYRQSKAQAMPEHSVTNSIRQEENRIEEIRQEESDNTHTRFFYVDEEKILDLKIYLEKTFPVLMNDLKIQYGAGVFNERIEDFSKRNLEKNWKNSQDLRGHVTNFLRVQEEIKEKNSAKKEKNASTKSTVGTDGKIESFGSFN